MSQPIPPSPEGLPANVRRVLAKTSTELNATPKQLAFTAHRLAGASQTEAYKRAYDVDTTRSYTSVAQEAHLVARNPKVSQMLTEGRTEMNHVKASRGAQWREAIDNGLWEIAHAEGVKPADRLQAFKLAGAQVGVQAFTTPTSSSDLAAASLLEALKAFESELCESGLTVDITAIACSDSQQNPYPVDLIAPTPDEWDGLHDGSD